MFKRLFLFFLLFYSKTVLSQFPKTFWSDIDPLQISDTTGFSNFTDFELQLIESINKPDSLMLSFVNDSSKLNIEDNFFNRRARIKISLNGKKIRFSDIKDDFFSTVCYGGQIMDTITIYTGVGFFAGFGYQIQIFDNKFSIIFSPEADNEDEIYAWNKDDIKKMQRIEVPANNQHLALSKFTNAKGDLILVGRIKADFREFYEINSGKMETQKYSIDLVFQSRIIKMPLDIKQDLQ